MKSSLVTIACLVLHHVQAIRPLVQVRFTATKELIFYPLPLAHEIFWTAHRVLINKTRNNYIVS